MLRCKASLGRKRQHRAPSLRPNTTEGESWIFRDSTGEPSGDGDESWVSVLAQCHGDAVPVSTQSPGQPQQRPLTRR